MSATLQADYLGFVPYTSSNVSRSAPGGNRMESSAPPRRVTIIDVARHARVSTTAVSKVLRNAYGTSPAMRAKVQAAIAELGYRPHAGARAMRGQTYTIGVM